MSATPRRPGRLSALILAVMLGAAGFLIVRGPDKAEPPPSPTLLSLPGRVSAADAWPNAERGAFSGRLPDGASFAPGLFLDARTAVGSARTRDGRSVRLIVRRADESVRELRRAPSSRGPTFDSFASSATHVFWVEQMDDTARQIWVADLRDPRSAARLLTTDTGAAVFAGSPYDLLINDGRVFWTAQPTGLDSTEIRSVPIGGGRVSVRTENGSWSLAGWPWLTDGADQASVARLRDLVTGRGVEISGSGTDLLTCGPVWCRVAVVAEGGIARLDLMRHDGSGRSTMAAGTATAAGVDVAVLGRFELLFEPRAVPGENNTARLAVYDIGAARVVEISPEVDQVFCGAGMLWWPTGDGAATVWNVVDLRTV
jgi:hypothetical protein